MKILHLETSSKNCSVAVSHNEKLICLCEEKSENYKQSESLHTFIEWAMEGANIGLNEIDAVCLGSGPGSYTGLRIGAASVKGLCYGLNVPLIAVNSMESMLEPFLQKGFDLIIPLIDARRMEVYTAVYDGNTGEELEQAKALILDENSFSAFSNKKIIFVGDGAKKLQENFSFNNAEYQAQVYPSAQYLIKGAFKKFENKNFENLAYYEPFYLKEFNS